MPDSSRHHNELCGDKDDAAEWIEASSLRKDDKKALTDLIERFPHLGFCRDSDEDIRRIESKNDIKIPSWFKKFRLAFSTVKSDDDVLVMFDGFDREFPTEDHAIGAWYTIIEPGYSNKEDRTLLHMSKKMVLAPIAVAYDIGASTLAINVAGARDKKVYEFVPDNLLDNQSEGTDVAASVYPVFDSYTSMISHMRAVKLKKGTRNRTGKADSE